MTDVKFELSPPEENYLPNKMDTAYVYQNDPIMALTRNGTCMRDFGGLYQCIPLL